MDVTRVEQDDPRSQLLVDETRSQIGLELLRGDLGLTTVVLSQVHQTFSVIHDLLPPMLDFGGMESLLDGKKDLGIELKVWSDVVRITDTQLSH